MCNDVRHLLSEMRLYDKLKAMDTEFAEITEILDTLNGEGLVNGFKRKILFLQHGFLAKGVGID